MEQRATKHGSVLKTDTHIRHAALKDRSEERDQVSKYQ